MGPHVRDNAAQSCARERLLHQEGNQTVLSWLLLFMCFYPSSRVFGTSAFVLLDAAGEDGVGE